VQIVRFELERYRSFARRTSVQLRPLTIIYGYNSAGKSALLRALPLIAASTGGAQFGPLALDADVARGATWDDLLARYQRRNRMDLRVAWADPDPVAEIEWSLTGEDGRHKIASMRCVNADGASILELLADADSEDLFHVKGRTSGDVARAKVVFDGLRPEPTFERVDGTMPEGAESVLFAAHRLIGSMKRSVQWLGAVRRAPGRRMTRKGIPRHLSGDGWWTWDVLGEDAAGDQSLQRMVSRDLERMFPHRLRVQTLGTEYTVSLEPSEGEPFPVSVLDVGEGVVQVLPVLTTLAMAERGDLGPGTTIAIEQPEMHLHPKAEVILAEVMARTAASTNRPNLVVETHSENLLLSLQLMVAKGKLPAADVAILWVSQEQGVSRMRELSLDDHGRIADWPPGVFSEDLDLARQILRARREV
jgi:predicted ATPase